MDKIYVEYEKGQKYAKDSSVMSDNPDSFADAGMLLSSSDVVVDIDHLPKESIEAMLKEFKIKTFIVWTDRGVHLWFRKPNQNFRKGNGVCKLGFEIEQHTKKSRPNGMTIKRNGILRKTENIDVRAELPDIFNIPRGKRKLDDLTGMSEGDGRNQKLFQHRCKMQSVTDPQKILRFINKWVFAEPLSASEMDTICRESIPQNAEDDYFIADRIMQLYSMVRCSGELWWINEGKYDHGIDDLRHLVYTMCEGQKTYYVDEVIKQIEYRAKIIDERKGFPVKLKNGYVKKGKFYYCKELDFFTPYTINIEYDPNTEPVQIVDDYINQLTGNDQNYRMLLLESFGYIMITEPEKMRSLGKFFFLRGDGSNGKGTALEILRTIFGTDNCATLSIKQICDPRYNITLVGKLVNLGDDVEPSAITEDQMKMLKNLATADTFSIRHMYAEATTATITAKLFFTSNNNLKTFDKGYAYERRVVWLPMFTKIDKPDPYFISKITSQDALKYWIKLIVEGYQRLYAQGHFTRSAIVEDFNRKYHAENNPSKEFALSLSEEDIVGKTMTDIRLAFTDWAGDETVKFSPKEFKLAVKTVTKCEIKCSRVNGLVRKIFVRSDSESENQTEM